MFCSTKWLIFQLKLKVEIVDRNDKMIRKLKSKATFVHKSCFVMLNLYTKNGMK